MSKRLTVKIPTATECNAIYAFLQGHLHLVQTGLMPSGVAAKEFFRFVSVLGQKGLPAALVIVEFQTGHKAALGRRRMLELCLSEVSLSAVEPGYVEKWPRLDDASQPKLRRSYGRPPRLAGRKGR